MIKVTARAAVGDLRVAPRLVHVDKHEDVRRAVAHILVVEARRPAWLRHDRHARFADQLSRRLVETDDGVLFVRRFGVELEDVFHARDKLCVDLRDAPHLLLPRFQLVFGEPAPDRLRRERFVFRQPHHRVSQQLERPARSPGWRRRARGRDEQRLLLRRELAVGTGSRLFAERSLEPLLDEAALRSIDRRPSDDDVLRDRDVARPGRCCEQDLGALQSAEATLAGLD